MIPSSTINTTATTPELELSQLVPATNDVDEEQQPEPNEFASDSGFSEGDSDDDSSLSSSHYEPDWHNSIPYAPKSDYPFPCSREELEQYEPCRYSLISRLREHDGLDPLHLAPIDNPHKIVDIGTGTGIWADKVADRYKSAVVVGTDVNAIVLREYTASNGKFIQDDVERVWTYKQDSLDFVRAGLLLNSIKNRPRLFSQTLHCLKPGAWAEWVDFHYLPHTEDGSIVNNGNFDFHQTLAAAMAKHKFNLQAITVATRELKSAGFINVQGRVLKMPIGGWHDDPELKEIGETFRRVIKDSIPDIGMRVIPESLGWSWEEMMVLGGKAKGSLDLPFRTYFPLHIVIGQKQA